MMRLIILSAVFLSVFSSCAKSPQETQPIKKQKIEDVIPITAANMRGHRSLYNEGWFVVTSTKDAFSFAKEHSILRSYDAISAAQKGIEKSTEGYANIIKDDISDSIKTGKKVFDIGTGGSKTILKTTHRLAGYQIDYAQSTFIKAWDRFVKGNLSLAERTESDRTELANTFGSYAERLGSDFDKIYEISGEMNTGFAERIIEVWDSAIDDAGAAFEKEYKDSAENQNTLIALVDILQGYAKALYAGLIKPAGKSAADGVVTGVENIGKAVFIPVAAAISVTGRTVQSVGLTLYYTTSMGVKIISPTLEAGFLSGLSILSLGTTPITYVTGASVGAVNQVAMSAAAPVAATGQAAISTAIDTAKVVALVSYDAIKGSTKVIFHQAASGVVLGYNALMALPTHLLMSVADVAFFLAWDGPNLVLAMAEGKVDGFSTGELPVGTVVDLRELQKEEEINVRVIETDPSIIRGVLERVSEDVRIKDE